MPVTTIDVSCDKMIGGLEGLLGHVVLAHHDLQESRAVADDEKVDLPARSAIVQPALEW